LNRWFSEEEMKMTNKYRKKCSTFTNKRNANENYIGFFSSQTD
jgi:hypothetical protein